MTSDPRRYYTNPPINSVPENLPGLTVTDSTVTRFEPLMAPDTYRKYDPYERFSTTHYHPPQAWGDTKLIAYQLVTGQLSRRLDMLWYTQVMPRKDISGDTIQLNVMHFDESLAPITPYEGVPRITSTRRNTQTHTIVRRAKGFKMEHSYMKTREGQTMYYMNLRHLSNIVTETMCYDIITTLCTGQNYALEWEKRHNYFNRKTEEEILEREKTYFACLQKNSFGFQKLDTLVTARHAQYNVHDLDTYIFPQRALSYLRVAPPENTTFSVGGEVAVKNIRNVSGNLLDDKDAYFIIGNGRYKVYLTRTYMVTEYNIPEDPMLRNRQIGEYNKMIPLHPENGENYKSVHRTIEIYDENRDEWVKISLKDALNANAGIVFDDKGFLKDVSGYTHYPDQYKSQLDDHFLFKYDKESDEYVPVDHFGDIRPKHLSVNTYMEWAKSVVSKLSVEMGGCPTNSVYKIVTNALDVIKRHNDNVDMLKLHNICLKDGVLFVDQQPDGRYYDTDYNTFMFAKFDKKTGAVRLVDDEYVGFLGNWPSLVQYASTKSHDDPVVQFVDLIKNITNRLKKVNEGCKFFDKKYTTPDIIFQSEESVVLSCLFPYFENTLPMWIYKHDDMSQINAAGAPAIYFKQLADLFNKFVVKYKEQTSKKRDDESKQQIDLDNFKMDSFEDITTTIDAISKIDVISERAEYGVGPKFKIGNELYALNEYLNTATDSMISILDCIYTLYNRVDNFIEYLYPLSSTEQKKGINIRRFLKYYEEMVPKLEQEDPDTAILLQQHLENAYKNLNESERNIKKKKKTKNPGGWYTQSDIPTYPDVMGEVITPISGKFHEPNTGLKLKERGVGRFQMSIPIQNLDKLFIVNPKKFTKYPIPYIFTVSMPGDFNNPANLTEIKQLYETLIEEGKLQPIPQAELDRYWEHYQMVEDSSSSSSSKGRLTIRDDANKRLKIDGNPYSSVVIGGGHKGRKGKGSSYSRPIGGKDSFESKEKIKSKPLRLKASQIKTGFDMILLEYSNEILKDNLKAIRQYSTHDLNKALATILLFTPVKFQVLNAFIDNDFIFPMNFLILRPHQRYTMGMAIKLKAGDNMGATYVNPSMTDYQEEDNSMVKTRFGHFSWHSKSVVIDPTRVFHIHDVFCAAGEGGAGSKFYTAEDRDSYNPDDEEFAGKDIFSVIIPYEQRDIPNLIDCTGKFRHFEGRSHLNTSQLHYSTAGYYDAYWGWRTPAENSSTPMETTHHPLSDGHFVPNKQPKNTTMWRGSTWNYDINKKKFVLSFGIGHFGQFAFPGCKAYRNGGLEPWVVPPVLHSSNV